eukprot:5964558-Prymnesium_polylepis.1
MHPPELPLYPRLGSGTAAWPWADSGRQTLAEKWVAMLRSSCLGDGVPGQAEARHDAKFLLSHDPLL